MKFAVIVFPGSNCDVDCYKAVTETINQSVEFVWHTTEDLSTYDGILIPGGFSYGDYLRCGAIAQFTPVMKAVVQAAHDGKYILGICNGFQVLTEAGLLPGALLRNQGMKFRCQDTILKVENPHTVFTSDYTQDELIQIPIAHGEGNYYCDETTLNDMIAHQQIVFRYASDENPNGSLHDIAGICNRAGNVMGLMPHPERAVNSWLGSQDGRRMFTSILSNWREKHESQTIRA